MIYSMYNQISIKQCEKYAKGRMQTRRDSKTSLVTMNLKVLIRINSF